MSEPSEVPQGEKPPAKRPIIGMGFILTVIFTAIATFAVVALIFKIVKTIAADGTTILLVEQNAHMALGVANRAYVLEVGKIVLEGPAAELAKNDEIRRAYLGIHD